MGRSDTSILMNAGISAGMGNSTYISTKATAESMPATASLWLRCEAFANEAEEDIKNHSFAKCTERRAFGCMTQKSAGKQRIHIFSHPDCDRRHRNFTDSCDASAACGLYRRWGVSPRLEDW